MPSLLPPIPWECRIAGFVCSVPWDPGPCAAGIRHLQGTDRAQTPPAGAAHLTDLLLPNAPQAKRSSPLPRLAHSLWCTFPQGPSSHSDLENCRLHCPSCLPFCLISLLSTFPSGNNPGQIFKVCSSPGLGFPVPEALAWLLMVPLPHLILLYFFFHLPTLLEVKTLLSVAFLVFSL